MKYRIILLDSRSTKTLCSTALLERLGLKGTREKLSLTTVSGDGSTNAEMVVLEVIGSKGENARAGVVLLPIVYALPTLPSLQGCNASLQIFAFAFTFKTSAFLK